MQQGPQPSPHSGIYNAEEQSKVFFGQVGFKKLSADIEDEFSRVKFIEDYYQCHVKRVVPFVDYGMASVTA